MLSYYFNDGYLKVVLIGEHLGHKFSTMVKKSGGKILKELKDKTLPDYQRIIIFSTNLEEDSSECEAVISQLENISS